MAPRHLVSTTLNATLGSGVMAPVQYLTSIEFLRLIWADLFLVAWPSEIAGSNRETDRLGCESFSETTVFGEENTWEVSPRSLEWRNRFFLTVSFKSSSFRLKKITTLINIGTFLRPRSILPAFNLPAPYQIARPPRSELRSYVNVNVRLKIRGKSPRTPFYGYWSVCQYLRP